MFKTTIAAKTLGTKDGEKALHGLAHEEAVRLVCCDRTTVVAIPLERYLELLALEDSIEASPDELVGSPDFDDIKFDNDRALAVYRITYERR